MILEEAQKLKDQGMERAAIAWEKLTSEVPPIDPINIFKAVCSIKCAELMSRFSTSKASHLGEHITVIADFLEAAIKEAGGTESGTKEEALRAVDIVEKYFPFDREAFGDPALFATRLHTLDGIIMLCAQRFNKEKEVRELIENMQVNFMKIIVRDLMKVMGANEPS